MTNTHPPMTIDTLAVAIAAQHYSHVMFPTTPDPERLDVSDVANECATRAAEYADETAAVLDIRAALLDYVADDLHDYAHNANHADYAPLFNLDPDDDSLFQLFISDELADRVTTILYPIVYAAYLQLPTD